MTAAEEQLVAELAEALDKHQGRYVWEVRSWGDGHRLVGCICGWDGTKLKEHQMAALLPVVLADRRRAVAEALREAADVPLKSCCPEHAGKRLRARAGAVEGGGR